MRRSVLVASLSVSMLLPAGAEAMLERAGPVDPANGGYPAWYQDTTGLALEFCKPANQSELNDGWCLILPPDVPNGAAPETFPTNYSEEHFYWNATAGSRAANAVLVLSLEAAFAAGPPINGDQVTFGRLRITVPTLPFDGDYKVYTPFGVFDFPGLRTGERLFYTSDIGIGCGTDFGCAMNSLIGPFLLPSPFPGGPEVPPIPDLVAGTGQDPFYDLLVAGGGATPYPGTGKKYVSDPARLGPVTGGTCFLTLPVPASPQFGDCVMGNASADPPGTPERPVYFTADGLRDPNIFRIEVNGGRLYEEQAFTTAGRVMTAAIPAKVTVNRASYASNSGGNKLDVFATAFPAFSGREPGTPWNTEPNPPDLGFYPAPCTTDAAGRVTGPPSQTGLRYYQMPTDGFTNWWGQVSGADVLVVPAQVCVQDLNARNAIGQAVPEYYLFNVTDEVHVNWAEVMWNPNDPANPGGTLTVSAQSSDAVNNPTLTLSGLGPLENGSIRVGPLAAPPAKVTVISSRGGSATIDTTTGRGIPVIGGKPIANADSAMTSEDCQAQDAATRAQPHTACTSPIVVDVLANDTLDGSTIDRASATVAISAQPNSLLGAATVTADKRIAFTPRLDVNGTVIIGYKVTVGATTSNEGYLTIVIAPMNDSPVAVNDTTGTTNNRQITVDLLANDIDPDGAADLSAAVNASMTSAPAGGTATWSVTGRQLIFTGSGAGAYTFAYQAQDAAGAISNTGAVTINVNSAENIVVSKSQYVVSKGRWVVSGSDSISGGQTLTIAYDNGSSPGFVIGTAPVVAGAWSFDQVGLTGLKDPRTTGATRLRITSPLGGSITANIQLK